jgi:anaerobic selenocysteine-containing dehydrogenase
VGFYTRSDFDHCEVAFFLGKNPWMSHSFPHARVTLKEIAKDPARCLIVVDPRRSESAELADIHLQVRPGTDAWLLAGMVATLVQDHRLSREWLARHAEGLGEVLPHFAELSIAGVQRGVACQRTLCARPRDGSQRPPVWPRSRISVCR